jgi:uncharacterized protein YbaR (Trm112 family)
MVTRQQDISALRCPVTKSPLTCANDALLSHVNALISIGEVQTRGSQLVSEALEAGLVNVDETLLYPLQGGVVCLLAAEAIEIAEHWPVEEEN